MPEDPHEPVDHLVEVLAKIVVDASYRLHRTLGPGMRESVYERLLAHDLRGRGLAVDRQHPINFEYAGLSFENGFRADLLVNRALLVEVKSVELMSPAHLKQTLTAADSPCGARRW